MTNSAVHRYYMSCPPLKKLLQVSCSSYSDQQKTNLLLTICYACTLSAVYTAHVTQTYCRRSKSRNIFINKNLKSVVTRRLWMWINSSINKSCIARTQVSRQSTCCPLWWAGPQLTVNIKIKTKARTCCECDLWSELSKHWVLFECRNNIVSVRGWGHAAMSVT